MHIHGTNKTDLNPTQMGEVENSLHRGGTWFPLVVQFGNSRKETFPLLVLNHVEHFMERNSFFICSGHSLMHVEKKIVVGRIKALTFLDELN